MAAELPLHRHSIDHIFTLKKSENEQEKKPAIGPFV